MLSIERIELVEVSGHEPNIRARRTRRCTGLNRWRDCVKAHPAPPDGGASATRLLASGAGCGLNRFNLELGRRARRRRSVARNHAAHNLYAFPGELAHVRTAQAIGRRVSRRRAAHRCTPSVTVLWVTRGGWRVRCRTRCLARRSVANRRRANDDARSAARSGTTADSARAGRARLDTRKHVWALRGTGPGDASVQRHPLIAVVRPGSKVGRRRGHARPGGGARSLRRRAWRSGRLSARGLRRRCTGRLRHGRTRRAGAPAGLLCVRRRD
jgi:hypothetical protein